MNAHRMGAWLLAVLAGSTIAASGDHPAGQLPTHIVIARGDDAWSGRLRALQFLPTPYTLDAPAPPDRWEASRLLDLTASDARQLWTFRHGDAPVRSPVVLRWPALSPAQQAAIDGGDGLGSARVGYLRGERRHEHDGYGLRPRTSVLGAMRGAHVQLLGPPGFVLDMRHGPFRAQHARRPWMVYIGANDGMLHGFDALTGEERFAVMSDAVLPLAAQNASPGNPVPGPVCGHPFAADAWTGSQWRSVLACANGTMGSGLFLVDVTDPESATPPSLLAYDASDDPTVGRVQGPIPIVPLSAGGAGQPRWFAVSGNGASNAGVESRLLLLALDQPRSSPWVQTQTAHAIRVPSVASRGGLGAPAVALGPSGLATLAYAADSRGQVWRFDLTGAPPWSNALGTNEAQRRTPLFRATSRNGGMQHIPGPILLAATANGPLLVFTAIDDEGHATVYGVADRGAHSVSREELASLSATDVGDGTVIRQDGNPTENGWRIDLPAGQAPDDLSAAGANSLLLLTRDVAGRDRAYFLDTRTGLPASKGDRTGHVLIGTPLVTVQSVPPARTLDGAITQALRTTLWQADGDRVRRLESNTYTLQLGRLNWREMTEAGAR
ncbi:hypothetical protein LMG7141_02963 [Ralstonia condita]|uniref:Pilus assembly protein PilY n=1 Tax=Ralstonia condita TaxID=3058600 RepID=A0ABN9J0G8_9RALS|nr:hypothetical protein LMG7141_02963 [Ralstonia sp. LMG 7141]